MEKNEERGKEIQRKRGEGSEERRREVIREEWRGAK